jgi:hypothetical protein
MHSYLQLSVRTFPSKQTAANAHIFMHFIKITAATKPYSAPAIADMRTGK